MGLRPRTPCAVPADRDVRHLSHGELHYRAGGAGPVVLALHASPSSSASLTPVVEALADRHRVIAPDTPGYGLSTALPQDAPSLEDFADVFAAFLDDIGVSRAAVYGTHTGAALALALAHRHPQRVSALVLDGLSAFDPAEVDAFRHRYLVAYTPSWDGAHVMRLWSRVKDLYTWFPWHEQSPARRLAGEPSDAEVLQAAALGFLQSGDAYAKAYMRAAELQPDAWLAALRIPTLVMARPEDLIADHLDRLTPAPNWTLRRLPPGPQAWRASLVEGLAAGAPASRLDAGLAPAASLHTGGRFLPVGQGWLHAILDGPPQGAVRILLPNLPGDLADLVETGRRRWPDDRLIAISPPGCGRSDPLAAETSSDPTATLDAVLEVLDLALAQLIEPTAGFAIAAEGAAVVIARRWAARRGGQMSIDTLNPLAWTQPGAPEPQGRLLARPSPRFDGAHLTAAWFQLRDLALYDIPPGFGPPTRRPNAKPVDIGQLDRRFRSLIEGPECADLLEHLVSIQCAGRLNP